MEGSRCYAGIGIFVYGTGKMLEMGGEGEEGWYIDVGFSWSRDSKRNLVFSAYKVFLEEGCIPGSHRPGANSFRTTCKLLDRNECLC